MYNGTQPIPPMQDACIAPSIYNSWQSDRTKCGGRSLLADVNRAIFIPKKQDDKGSSVLLFYHMYFTCDTQSLQNSEKHSCSRDNYCGKVRWLFYIKNEPQKGALLVGGEGQFESDNIFVKG